MGSCGLYFQWGFALENTINCTQTLMMVANCTKPAESCHLGVLLIPNCILENMLLIANHKPCQVDSIYSLQ